MYLLYVDESGHEADTSQEYFVLGAIAVFESVAYHLSKEFDNVQSRWLPGITEPVKFHAAEIRHHSSEPWHSLSKETCNKILSDLCRVIDQSHPSVCLFGVAIHKPSWSNEDPLERAFRELCGHFDAYLMTMNSREEANKEKKHPQRGLMILDSRKYTGRLDRLLLRYRSEGTTFGQIKYYADAPCFADSKVTRLLQAADLVAHTIFRRYQHSDAWLFDKLIGRFHTDSAGVIHGLIHLKSGWYRDCRCPACMSRVMSKPRLEDE